jgi:hypothetical protein
MSDDELDLAAESEEEEQYVQYDIATYPSDYTLSGIQELWKAEDLIIPDFQREFVWSMKQSSLLIESFLMGLPVPSVFFYVDEQNKNLVIDGSCTHWHPASVAYLSFSDQRLRLAMKGFQQKSPLHSRPQPLQD